MTSPDRSKGDRSRDEVLAGEYVLGVLSANDRRTVEARMASDGPFAAIVQRWQENLSSFNDDYGTEQPPEWIYPRIEARLYGPVRSDSLPARSLGGWIWNSLALWRTLAVASVVVAAGAWLANTGGLVPTAPKGQLVADLSGEGNAISLVARYDNNSGRLTMTPVAAGKADEKSLELWLIKGDNPAVSLGVLPQTGEGQIEIPAAMRSQFGEGVVLAISVEPFGGSPTGKATGPVVAAGPARLQ